MYRFLVKPRWIAFHVLVLALMVTMVNLGFWQLRRLDERRAANHEVSSRTSAAVVSTADLPADSRAAQWRRVTVAGVWDPAGQVLIRNRSLDGLPGLHVVTALRDRAGHAVLVNRGFIALADEANPPAPTPGPVTVVGRVRVTQTRGRLGPRDPATGTLTTLNRVDVARVQQQSADTLAPFYLELVTENPLPAKAPLPLPLPGLDEGPHLSYAIQWFIFSACAAAGWVLVVRKSAGKAGHDRGRARNAEAPLP
ncbi:MAG: SURF1 family protein [Acidimicrobiales bacterium]